MIRLNAQLVSAQPTATGDDGRTSIDLWWCLRLWVSKEDPSRFPVAGRVGIALSGAAYPLAQGNAYPAPNRFKACALDYCVEFICCCNQPVSCNGALHCR